MRSRRCIRYICDFCNKGMFQKPAMVKHEKYCFHNPARHCKTCEFHGNMQSNHPMRTMIDTITQMGIDAVRPIAEGCPACICAALIQARKAAKIEGDDSLLSYLWVDVTFDYKTENDRFYNAVRESRPEDFYP